jgi:hypothetical protein
MTPENIEHFKIGLMIALNPGIKLMTNDPVLQLLPEYMAASVFLDVLIESGFSPDEIEQRLTTLPVPLGLKPDGWLRLSNILGVLCLSCGGLMLPRANEIMEQLQVERRRLAERLVGAQQQPEPPKPDDEAWHEPPDGGRYE